MMLKQTTPSRSQKTRGFKVKHALQICLLLAISIWLLYRVKQRSHFTNGVSDPFPDLTDKLRQENPIIKFGRKDLKLEKEEETEIDDKVEEINAMEGRGGGDDEIDGNDQDRVEQEEEEDDGDSDSDLEDLIDEEDREKEEVTEESVEGSQMKEERADDDVLLSRNEDEIGSLKKVKEDDVRFSGEEKRRDS